MTKHPYKYSHRNHSQYIQKTLFAFLLILVFSFSNQFGIPSVFVHIVTVLFFFTLLFFYFSLRAGWEKFTISVEGNQLRLQEGEIEYVFDILDIQAGKFRDVFLIDDTCQLDDFFVPYFQKMSGKFSVNRLLMKKVQIDIDS